MCLPLSFMRAIPLKYDDNDTLRTTSTLCYDTKKRGSGIAMAKFDNVKPPKKFARHHKTILVLRHYEFTADARIFLSETTYHDLKDNRYLIDIELWSKTDDLGMAVDFRIIDNIYKTHLQPKLDGQLLNETLPDMNITLENLIHWMWETLSVHLPEDVSLNAIAMYETPEQGVRFTRDIMAQ